MDEDPRGRARFDTVIVGGRVIDPESGTDAELGVGINGDTIAAVTSEHITGRRVIDARGLIVAPGWIDLHSHAQTLAGSRLRVRDGVTTALDLEAGRVAVGKAYHQAAVEGRAVNYGFSASWQQARMTELADLDIRDMRTVYANYGNPAWKRAATPRQVGQLLDRLAEDLADGAIGIGLLVGYAPRVEPSEYVRVSELAARTNTGTFTHARDLIDHSPSALIDGALEIVTAADETGARAHYCHVNSTSLRHVDRVLGLIEKSPAPVTTEAYPYGAGSTMISADFLAPSRLHERQLTPNKIVYTPTGERIQDYAQLEELRRTDPGASVIVHLLDETAQQDRRIIDRALTFPGTIVCSDAAPVTWPAERHDPESWPPPATLQLHPRTAGTYSKFFRQYVRETARMTMLEAVERCTLGPARVLQDYVPAMRRKGRVQTGCDADLVVFDPATVADHATYLAGTRSSTGYAAVLVGGEAVVIDDHLLLDCLPGRPVTAASGAC